MTFRSVNPATSQTIATFEPHDRAAVDSALSCSRRAMNALAAWGLDGRAERLRKAADLLEHDRDRYAAMMTEEMGKPIGQAKAEIDKCAWVCRHYADNAARYLEDEIIEAREKGEARLRRLPLGPIFAIMPWNYPFWQVFRFAAPTLMAGNPGLLKHASNVPRCALAIEEVLVKAGFTDHAFQTLLIGSDAAADVIADDRVAGVTLTGSEKAGAAVAREAGAALKPCVMELGGSDAYIVMASAELDEAVSTAVTARVQNNGQSCIAAKRFIVHADVYDAFAQAFTEQMGRLRIGDPFEDDTDLGPLVDPGAADEAMKQADDSLAAGALARLQPERGEHAYLSPGVLEAIPERAPVHAQEVFAPIAMLYRVDNLDAAIALANDHRYGLGSSFWSGDEVEIAAACDRLEAGSTYVNQMVASDPRLPFGGVKKSGFGRELGREGAIAFTNAKTIAIRRD